MHRFAYLQVQGGASEVPHNGYKHGVQRVRHGVTDGAAYIYVDKA